MAAVDRRDRRRGPDAVRATPEPPIAVPRCGSTSRPRSASRCSRCRSSRCSCGSTGRRCPPRSPRPPRCRRSRSRSSPRHRDGSVRRARRAARRSSSPAAPGRAPRCCARSRRFPSCCRRSSAASPCSPCSAATACSARPSAWLGIRIPFTTAAVVIAQTFVALPFLVITVEGSLRTAGTRYETVAAGLGAGRFTVFRRITLPLVGPGPDRRHRAVLRARARRVRRDRAVRRQLARHDPHDAARDLHGVQRRGRQRGHGDRALAHARRSSRSRCCCSCAAGVRMPRDDRRGRRHRSTPGVGHRDGRRVPARRRGRGRGIGEIARGARPERIGQVDAARRDRRASRARRRCRAHRRARARARRSIGGDDEVGAHRGRPGRRARSACSASSRCCSRTSARSRTWRSARARRAMPKREARAARIRLARAGRASPDSTDDAPPRSRAGSSSGSRSPARSRRAPSVLLLDEPFASLDVQTAADMRRLVAEQRAEPRIPTLLVTHDPLDAIVLADRAAILHDGRIVQQGRPAEVLGHPATPFVGRARGREPARRRRRSGRRCASPWSARRAASCCAASGDRLVRDARRRPCSAPASVHARARRASPRAERIRRRSTEPLVRHRGDARAGAAAACASSPPSTPISPSTCRRRPPSRSTSPRRAARVPRRGIGCLGAGARLNAVLA